MNQPDWDEPSPPATPESLKAYIIKELCDAAGLRAGGWQQRGLTGALNRPIDSVARILSDFDATVGHDGIAAGFATLLDHFVQNPCVYGAPNVPTEGPLIIASNHPGAYDIMLISSMLGRHDLQIVSSTVRLFRAMPNFHGHLIEVGGTPEERRQVIPESARHLEAGGAVLIFPSGLVDPDPDVLPGAHEALATWRPGIAALVNLFPSALVVETIASGVLSRRWVNSRLLRLQKVDWQRRKLAEMMQVIQQVVWPKTQKLSPRLSFGAPMSGHVLQCEAGAGGMLPLLVERAQALLRQHMAMSRLAPERTAAEAPALPAPAQPGISP
jgi:hypothetical protein